SLSFCFLGIDFLLDLLFLIFHGFQKVLHLLRRKLTFLRLRSLRLFFLIAHIGLLLLVLILFSRFFLIRLSLVILLLLALFFISLILFAFFVLLFLFLFFFSFFIFFLVFVLVFLFFFLFFLFIQHFLCQGQIIASFIVSRVATKSIFICFDGCLIIF